MDLPAPSTNADSPGLILLTFTACHATDSGSTKAATSRGMLFGIA